MNKTLGKIKQKLTRVTKFVALFICTSLLSLSFANAQEDEEAASSTIVYIAIDPSIVTNYAGDNSQKLGYLRITIELMLDNPEFIQYVEHHMPLLRALAIEVIGSKSEQEVKSLTGREEMRRGMLKNFRDHLLQETGNQIVKDIIFTNYLRQGG